MRGGGGGGGAGPGPGPGPGPGGHAPSSTAGPLAVAGAALDLSLPGDLREGTSRGDARRAAKDKDELDETGVSSDAGEVRGGGEKGSKPSGGNNLRPLSVVGDAGGFAASSAESAAAALGYVAQASLQLASVLDVPLRYPVAPGASRSYICDLQQVQPAEAKAGGGGLGPPLGAPENGPRLCGLSLLFSVFFSEAPVPPCRFAFALLFYFCSYVL